MTRFLGRGVGAREKHDPSTQGSVPAHLPCWGNHLLGHPVVGTDGRSQIVPDSSR